MCITSQEIIDERNFAACCRGDNFDDGGVSKIEKAGKDGILSYCKRIYNSLLRDDYSESWRAYSETN